ncbi:Retrovirus-related Pol polyprotein from transposon TNT 1-94 [Senna tora]|uniref:Retrovirus-related Pol polyprotein from transposon TNT 1-94 n=1 Tax=Senna tora TaxID=362788 RepID=A0A834SI63_9FABA|nr:Retrovirus-related Pol polyprotein from transposon TNT 1-94 [Senna tora]
MNPKVSYGFNSYSVVISDIDFLSRSFSSYLRLLTPEDDASALQYICHNYKAYLSFAINKVCQFMASPLEEHWVAVKHILRYLKVPNSFSWSFAQRSNRLWLDLVQRLSIEAWPMWFLICPGYKSLLKELQLHVTHTPVVYCDNLSAVIIAHNLVLHQKTKHMELDIHFVRVKVLQQALRVVHIPSVDQKADVLTKPLSGDRFSVLRTKLTVIDRNHTKFMGG